jgi:glycosyltransferase involved in cell wall biosynthesis
VLALPSRRDAFPKVVIEAMALAKPVVATSVGGLTEQISNEDNGLLVRPGSAEDLASALLRLLGDPDLARSMGNRGRRIAEERYRAETATGRIVEVYAEVCRTR